MIVVSFLVWVYMVGLFLSLTYWICFSWWFCFSLCCVILTLYFVMSAQLLLFGWFDFEFWVFVILFDLAYC